MAKNMIQFQKERVFTNSCSNMGPKKSARIHYSDLDGRMVSVVRIGSSKFCELKSRELYQCHRCHHQTSVKAGTIFQSTHLPLTKWFLGIYLMTQNKTGSLHWSCHASSEFPIM